MIGTIYGKQTEYGKARVETDVDFYPCCTCVLIYDPTYSTNTNLSVLEKGTISLFLRYS